MPQPGPLAPRAQAPHLRIPKSKLGNVVIWLGAAAWITCGLLYLQGFWMYVAWCVVPGTAVVFGWAIWLHRETLRFATFQHDLIAQGRWAEAREIAELRAKKGGQLRRATGVIQVGYAALRAGDLQTALTCYSEARRSNLKEMFIHDLSARGLASTYALLGELEAAKSWSQDIRPSPSGIPVVSAVVRARLEQFPEVLRLEIKPANDTVARLLQHEIRVFFLMRAYALESTGGDESEIRKNLGYAKPTLDDEYDYLTLNWPELAAFLSAHPWSQSEVPTTPAWEGGVRLPTARVLT